MIKEMIKDLAFTHYNALIIDVTNGTIICKIDVKS